MKRLAIRAQIRNSRCDINEHLETNFTDYLRRVSEVIALSCVGFGEEVFDKAEAHVVAHAVELGVDGAVVGFGGCVGDCEVAAELGDDGAVGESYDFGVDFVDAGPSK